jgi:hypothetical protein
MCLLRDDNALINDQQGQQNPKIDEHRQELLKLMDGSLFQVRFVPIQDAFSAALGSPSVFIVNFSLLVVFTGLGYRLAHLRLFVAYSGVATALKSCAKRAPFCQLYALR